jgi:hypothetical protein
MTSDLEGGSQRGRIWIKALNWQVIVVSPSDILGRRCGKFAVTAYTSCKGARSRRSVGRQTLPVRERCHCPRDETWTSREATGGDCVIGGQENGLPAYTSGPGQSHNRRPAPAGNHPKALRRDLQICRGGPTGALVGPFRSGVTVSQVLPSTAPEIASLSRDQQGVD